MNNKTKSEVLKCIINGLLNPDCPFCRHYRPDRETAECMECDRLHDNRFYPNDRFVTMHEELFDKLEKLIKR